VSNLKCEVRHTLPIFNEVERLKSGVRVRIMRKALRQALGPVRDRIKTNAKTISKTGSLWKSIGFKLSVKGARAMGIVGPRANYIRVIKGQTKQPAKYAHFIETGRTAYRPFQGKSFLRPGFNPPAVIEKMRAVVEQEIAATLHKT
jgi:hypothetical protein